MTASAVVAGASPTRGRTALALSLSIVLLVAAVLLSLLFGEVDSAWSVILAVRLPRVLLGVVAGAGLSAVGVALQALLRNPLAEPYVLGVSGGSALGAVIVISLGLTELTFVGASLIPVAALVGGLVATGVVYALASQGRGNATSLLLSGVIVNAIASAAITFIKTLVTAGTAQEMLYWLMGFLDAPSTTSLAFVSVYVALGLGVLLVDAGKLNLLALGPSAAENLGLDVRALSLRTLLACSLIVGAITSASGMIGFIGLIVPHAVRRIAGPDIRVVMPASIIGGGATLVICDLVSRLGFRLLERQTPVGAVTALIGGPLFLVILWRSRARMS
jgi:iron complex transport system permease protein